MIILDATNVFDAIRLTSEVLYNIRNGRVISKCTPAKREFSGIPGKEEIVDFKLNE